MKSCPRSERGERKGVPLPMKDPTGRAYLGGIFLVNRKAIQIDQ